MERHARYPAKINRPTFRKVFFRKRLFSILDGIEAEPLVWVSGPAGSGKTTFLSSYIDSREIPCIWYQFDDSDRDFATFLYYLELARQKVADGKRERLPDFEPGQTRDLTAFIHRYVERFFRGLPSDLLVVFDNFPDDPETCVLDVALQSLSRLPSGTRIAVVSRGEPPVATASLKLKGMLRTIGAEDMRLDPEEFRLASGLYGFKGSSPALLEVLHRTFEGWFAGLTLMAEVFRAGLVDEETARTAPVSGENAAERENSRVFEFFTSEIWDKTSDEVKNFLIRTSFLPRLTVHSARALTGYKHSWEILGTLCRRNLFTARSGHNPVIYQYHSLFREFLRDKAEKAFTRDQIRALKGKAARILEHGDQYEEAASLMREIHAWPDLSKLILKRGPVMLSQGRHQLLLSWIQAIPEKNREGDEKISFVHGLCLLPMDPGRSRELFLKGMDFASDWGEPETAYRCWARAVESVVYEAGRYRDVVPLLVRKEALERKFGGYPSKAVEAEVATGMTSILLLGGADYANLGFWTEKALALQKEIGETERYIQTCILAVLKHQFMGENLEMERVAQDLLASVSRGEYSFSLETLVYFVTALATWAAADFDRSVDLVAKGLDVVETSGVVTWEMQLLGQGVLSAFARLDHELAGKYLDGMRERAVKSPRNDQALYHYLQGYSDFQAGDFNSALVHAEKADALKREVGNPVYIARTGIALAQVCCALGQKESARKHLTSSRNLARESGSALLAFLCDLTAAGIALASGEMDETLNLLETALDRGAANQIISFWWFNRKALVDLMALALEEGIHPVYAQKVIQAHRLTALEQMPGLEKWPWPVKIYTLGRLEVIVNGNRIQFSRKAQEKPFALLKAILALGGRKISSDKIMEALWPDSDGPTAHRALATTLHRLRRLLDVKDAVLHTQGHVSLNPELCWVDIWAVERALGQITFHLEGAHQEEDGCSEISFQVEKSLALYKGHFLSNDGHEPWTITPRERLRSKYVRSIKAYCSRLEARREDEQAIYWYAKALEQENLAEELYQGLIRTHIRLGRMSDALAAYNQCRDTLSAVLGVEPSEETERLRGKIEDARTRGRGDTE